MPDWRELVGKGLSDLKLGAGEKEEVHAELAEHLEETYKALRARGLPEQTATQQTLAQVTDWQDLRRRIQTARAKENIMNDRVRQIWLPGTILSVAAGTCSRHLRPLSSRGSSSDRREGRRESSASRPRSGRGGRSRY